MYKYYQPNKKDLKDEYGDCTIRALSKALNIDWLSAFELTLPYCRKYQVPNIFFCSNKIEKEILEQMGFKYHKISNKKGSKRPTVKSFSKENKIGTFILNVANHEVAVVDGVYYDTWDSGDKCLYSYYERVK